MYGLGNLGMRPGNAKMMRPHNPLMSAGMTTMGGAKHFADGGMIRAGTNGISDRETLKQPLSDDERGNYMQMLRKGFSEEESRYHATNPPGRVFPQGARDPWAPPADQKRRGGLAHLAEGGQPDDAPRERLHGGTMSRISPQFTIGAVLRNLGLLGPKPAPVAPAPAAAVPVAPLANVGPMAAGYADGGEVGASGSISPLMQQMLAGYQKSQANPPARPFAPAQAAPAATPPATGALGAAARPPAAPFSLPGAQAQPTSMVPRSPIQPGLMQGRPMTPEPIVPYMSPGISAPGFAHGGSPHHVQGPGGGQEDLIDAKLSDGEWVGDATFVSDVGDGSNKEGARRLDKLRDLVAETKGRKGRYAPETPPLETLAKKAGIFGSKKPVKKANGGPLSNVRRDYADIPDSARSGTASRDAMITGVRG